MKARSALSGPTVAFALAGMWTAVIALWFVARPDGGGAIMLILAVVSAPVWLVIGVQRLRARRAGDEGRAPPA
ncbi:MULTISPECIES: hypothetical protein [Actinomycetes]|uniref:hypothetical protein n=1 Tax=Actinomycetes TaxID=1760 RepID=UPI001875BB2B|nr:hypothetical protein [Actinospica acidiphila]MBM4828375.1 hypothetical protein [Actinospica acidiphila]WTC22867.1 hypothetical protein OG872_09320 [Streptomyces althioticus]GGQ80214.1 hypothetical protein GCM10010250_59880 [Streptomyces althioticus]GGT75498.1 hypothetical protein GCM10010243_62860 [Streptomyces matensis]